MARGLLFVVSAPSGAGKTTLVKHLLERDSSVRVSVSHTTRSPRPGEQNGEHYHFIEISRFHELVADEEFLEYAEVHGNYYGTSRRWLESCLVAGQDVLLEIDWQGAQQVRRHFPDAVTIFILPPSIDELDRRLRGRSQDSEEVIARRVAAALDEMRHVDEFSFVIINDDLMVALDDLTATVRASRLRFDTQKLRHPGVFKPLLTT
jgi:guanylate kinase